MPPDRRARAVAERAAEIEAATGTRLPDGLALWRLAGGRPPASPRAGDPDDLGLVLEAGTEPERRQRLGVHHTPRAMAEELVDRAWPAGRAPNVADPACGGGALLLAAARRLVEAGAPVPLALDRLWGADVDPVAVATTDAALSLWAGRPVPAGHLLTADALVEDLRWPPMDLVVGNPPFLGQLAVATATSRDRAVLLRARFGAAVRAYTDPAGLFVLLGTHLAGDGGRVAMLVPESLLASRDAGGVRTAADERARVVDLWTPADRFAASVDVCVVVLERGSDGPPPPWSAPLAAQRGVPPVDLAAGPTVGDRAGVLASFRQEYYGLVAHLHEQADAPDGRPLVSTGMVDLGAIAWGARSARIARRTWAAPVVRDAEVEGRAADWLRRTTGPKVLVPSQTRVVEAAVDEQGATVPLTPLIAVVPSAATDLWPIAAALAAPPVSAWVAARTAGTALAAGALRLTAPLVRSISLPRDADGWERGTEAFRAGDLDRFGAAMTEAYGADVTVLDWWRPQAERVWSR